MAPLLGLSPIVEQIILFFRWLSVFFNLPLPAQGQIIFTRNKSIFNTILGAYFQLFRSRLCLPGTMELLLPPQDYIIFTRCVSISSTSFGSSYYLFKIELYLPGVYISRASCEPSYYRRKIKPNILRLFTSWTSFYLLSVTKTNT